MSKADIVPLASPPLRVAQADEPAAPQTSREQTDKQDAAELQEVVVTAERREENLLNVPMAVTALSGAQLQNTQSFRFEDYVGSVPGLTYVHSTGFGSELVIRGITTGNVPISPSVATYVDETPTTVNSPFAGSFISASDFDTYDMKRIEVLKGPQGTLYGSNALGGVVKFVTNPPDPKTFAASVETGASSVDHGTTGSDAHGMLNLPLGSDLALRLVAFDNYYPGYIDDPARNATDINGSRYVGGRASLLYEPTDALSVRFNALYQNRSWADWGNEDVNPNSLTPIYGNYVEENAAVGQPGHVSNQIYNLTINADTPVGKLLSTTSYAKFTPHYVWDSTPRLGGFVSSLLGAPYGAAIVQSRPLDSYTQEIHLASADNTQLQWLIGGFYTDERSQYPDVFYPVDLTNHTVLYDFPANVGQAQFPTTYEEYAGFAKVDYYITQSFDIGVGGRYSVDKQTFREVGSGDLFGPVNLATDSNENKFTYSAEARWHLTANSMVYTRVATGFAPGGPNDLTAATPNAPLTYGPTTTTNYEVGVKSRMLRNRLTMEADVFEIDWSDIQLLDTVSQISDIRNGGTARSRGVEWSLGWVPIGGLTVGFNGSYTDARLTQSLAASLGGVSGDRLPTVPLLAGSASVEEVWPIFGDYAGVVGANWQFTGDRYGEFEVSPALRQQMPSFDILDLRAGVQNNRWSLTLYAKNVFNKIAINYLTDEVRSSTGPESAAIYQPRTIGATITVNF